jgi:hypothetical protein
MLQGQMLPPNPGLNQGIMPMPPLLPSHTTPLASLTPGFDDIIPPGSGPGGFMNPGSSRTADDHGIAMLQSWARADMDKWDLRNSRFERDQCLYELAPPQDMPRNYKNLVTLNDPRAMIEKVVHIIARHPNIIQIDPRPGADPSIAQKMENTLYDIDRAINQNWVEALNSPYRIDQAFSATLRGWIVSRTMLRPDQANNLTDDPSAIWHHEIVDPAVVYPYKAGGRIRRVTHAYQTSVGDMVRDPLLRPFLDPDWFNQDERSLCHVTALYWEAADGGYHAIIGGVGPGSGLSGNSGLWIKPPVELGYNPWTIVLCGGAGYRETPWDDQNYIERVGTGLLDPVAENQKFLNRMATRLNELLAQESNPAVSFFSASGQMQRVDIQAGARNYLMKDDKVELHRVGPDQRDFSPLWDIFSKRQSRGGIPEALFGDGLSENGLAAAVTLSATRDVLFPYSEGVNTHDALKYKLMLRLYRDFGPAQPLMSKIMGGAPAPGAGPMPGLPMGMGMPGGKGQGMSGMGMSPDMSQQPGGPPVGMGGMSQPGSMLSPFGQVLAATLDVFDIQAQGCDVQVTREDMTPQEQAARINLALSMVKEGIISRDTARSDYVKLRNPAKENIKILAEAVYQDPTVIRALIPLTLMDTGQPFLANLWSMTQNAIPANGAPGGAQPPGGAGGQRRPPEASEGPDNGQMPTQVTPPAAQGNWQANSRVGAQDPQEALLQEIMSQLTGGAQGGIGSGGTPPPGGQQSLLQNIPSPAERGF